MVKFFLKGISSVTYLYSGVVNLEFNLQTEKGI